MIYIHTLARSHHDICFIQAIKDEILGTGESEGDEDDDGEEGNEEESGSEDEEQEQQQMQIQVCQLHRFIDTMQHVNMLQASLPACDTCYLHLRMSRDAHQSFEQTF